MSEPRQQQADDQAQPLVSHLIELRNRLLRCVLTIVMVFLGLFYFANDIYYFVSEPLRTLLPEGTSMIATEVASPFLTPFKLTLVASIVISMPVILYQVWGFIAPGMYQSENNLPFPCCFQVLYCFMPV